MEARSRLRSVVTKLLLPIAFFAFVAWMTIFFVALTHLQQLDLGSATLMVGAAALLSFPWFLIVMAVLRRMHGSTALHDEHDDEP